MRPASNQIGWQIERHDGPKVGWVAIADGFDTIESARDHLWRIERTPEAEYRVNKQLAAREPEQKPFDLQLAYQAMVECGLWMTMLSNKSAQK